MAGTPPLLSAILIVRNEEKNLPRCLKSLEGLADEMVVVDTGSEDRTRELARKAGARVHEFPWNGNEAEARNASVAQATGRWLFQIDADEEVSPGLKEELLRVLPGAAAESVQAFSVVLRNFHLHGTGSRARIVRIGRARPGYAFAGVVHPAPEYREPILPLQGELLHYGYQWTPEIRQRKGHHLIDQLARRTTAEKATLRHFSENLMALLIAGERKTFLKEWERIAAFTPRERLEGGEALFWSHALGNALSHFAAEDDFTSGEAAAEEMIAHRPDHVRAALYTIQGAARREEWERIAVLTRPPVGFPFDMPDFFQSVPDDAATALAGWKWLAGVMTETTEKKIALPESLWRPALLPFLWQAEERHPGKLVVPEAIATALFALRPALDEGNPEDWAKIDRLTSSALTRSAPGSAAQLQALVTRYWLNQRLARAEENLQLVRETVEHHGNLRWLALAFPERPGPGGFARFHRRALLKV